MLSASLVTGATIHHEPLVWNLQFPRRLPLLRAVYSYASQTGDSLAIQVNLTIVQLANRFLLGALRPNGSSLQFLARVIQYLWPIFCGQLGVEFGSKLIRIEDENKTIKLQCEWSAADRSGT